MSSSEQVSVGGGCLVGLPPGCGVALGGASKLRGLHGGGHCPRAALCCVDIVPALPLPAPALPHAGQ